MKFLKSVTLLLLGAPVLNALSLPQTLTSVARRQFDPTQHIAESSLEDTNFALIKRKGGGGGGGRGGGGTSSGGSRSGGSSGDSAPAGNGGGRTSGGTGVAPALGGGRYYGGGATVPYSAGGRSPLGIAPYALLGGAALFPGLWLYSVYAYHLNSPYGFYNASARQNQTKPVDCLCEQYSECGCDANPDPSYVDSLVGNGSYTGLDKTLVNVADVNGTSTILVNGTLPNGTTAAGGATSDGRSLKLTSLASAGYGLMGAVVGLWFGLRR